MNPSANKSSPDRISDVHKLLVRLVVIKIPARIFLMGLPGTPLDKPDCPAYPIIDMILAPLFA